MPVRLDVELVRRHLARSREHAQQLIAAGRVEVRGLTASKPAAGVDPATSIRVLEPAEGADYASRGGHKLAGALTAFAELSVSGRRCLDAGASTGGFTDVLLRAGASAVVAVDVGYGQLAWALRTDERVSVHDRTNVRALTPEAIGGPVEVTVADLSFISLPLVLPALSACTRRNGDLVPMIKPQFELGRERLGRGGVVREERDRADAIRGVLDAAAALGWYPRGLSRSVLPGPSGNVEFFAWLRRDAQPPSDAVRDEMIRSATATAQPGGTANRSVGATHDDRW